MVTVKELIDIIGGFCKLDNLEAKYILLDREGAWVCGINCETECPSRNGCDPPPIKVIPLTDKLLVALKLYFPPKTKNYNDGARRRETKEFIKEWLRKERKVK